MAIGALIVACSYLLLTWVSLSAAAERASWMWLTLFFVILTFGELYILPTGLGFFARLAPSRLGATTVAAWFLAIFSGSLFAGLVGTLWSSFSRPVFFMTLAIIATIAALLLFLLDRPARRVEAQ
jgi:POT family proton-dependent oligopeptide transporter